jgi:uridine kinase
LPGSELRNLIAAAAGTARPVVLIDGRSGSGKSTLASELVSGWPGAQLVRLDDVYPGWDGLEAGSAQVAERMLAASDPAWRRWDWAAGAPAEWNPIDPEHPLVVEGSGALSRANRALATFGIWVELDEATRKQRALERDGDTYAPHWDRWAAQEVAFANREHPRENADLVVTA